MIVIDILLLFKYLLFPPTMYFLCVFFILLPYRYYTRWYIFIYFCFQTKKFTLEMIAPPPLRNAFRSEIAAVRQIRIETVTIGIVRMRAGIVGGFLQSHQHVEERIAVVFRLRRRSRFGDTNVFRRYTRQSLWRSARPRIRFEDILAGIYVGSSSTV